MGKKIETTSLRGISERFNIPLCTLRKWASERRFPGLIKKNRKLYVDIKRFKEWFYQDEIT